MSFYEVTSLINDAKPLVLFVSNFANREIVAELNPVTLIIFVYVMPALSIRTAFQRNAIVSSSLSVNKSLQKYCISFMLSKYTNASNTSVMSSSIFFYFLVYSYARL